MSQIDILFNVLPSFVVMHFINVISPGANLAMLLDTSFKKGRISAQNTIIGMAIGYSVFTVFVMFGFINILQQHKVIYFVMRYGGILYLFYKAYCMWASAGKINDMNILANNHKHASEPKITSIINGFKVTITNPAMPITLSAMFSAAIVPEAKFFVQIIIALWAIAGFYTYFNCLIYIFTTNAIVKVLIPRMKIVERTMAVIFAIFIATMLR